MYSSELIFQNYIAYLMNLIGFRLVSIPLQVDLFLYSLLSKNMMAPMRSLVKSQSLHKQTQIIERDIRVRGTA